MFLSKGVNVFSEVGISGVVDIAIMALIIYLVFVWFKRSRAAIVLSGMLIMATVYFLAQQFNLVLTAGVFQLFFAVILFAIVVIFQEEIRRFFEQVAVWSFSRRLSRGRIGHFPSEDMEVLVRTLTDLARKKIGALIVIKGRSHIAEYLDGGVDLGGRISEALLKSIFDPHSIGHDGAVVIEGDHILQFGAHLPLSKNLRKFGLGGTRHAAALGISEMTDVLCLVVSEERGTISFARHGDMRIVNDPESLAHIIERFYRDINPHRKESMWTGFFRRNYKEKLIALGLAVLLWFVQVYGSKVVYMTYTVPVEYAELQPGLEIKEIKPKNVDITFSGPRRLLYFLNKDQIQLFLRTLNLRPGTRTIAISGSNLSFPKNIKLADIEPKRVKVEVREKDEEGEEAVH